MMVKKCEKCPFFYWDDDVFQRCNLVEKYNFDIDIEIGVQEWCPLKNENVSVCYEGD